MKKIYLEVVFAAPHSAKLITIACKPGTTVTQAIHQSGILELFPEINLQKNKVGIWGKLVSLETTVNNGDRIEIYRDLIINPKTARRLRAAKKTKNLGG